VLDVCDLSIDYGPLRAVREVTIHVLASEIVCLVGPNGAGKSTTTLALAGVLPITSGYVELEGTRLSGLSPEEIVQRGLSLVPEGRHIFSDLTVRENLSLAAGVRGDSKAFGRDLEHICKVFPFLEERRNQRGGTLSGGEQQQLAIARALLTSPRLLVMDEPALGLAPVVVQQLYKVLLDLRREGVTMLIVEQSMERAMQVADRLYVMRSGRVVLSGRSEEISASDMKRAYFGVKSERGDIQ
jgi:branched-chain amino acid transport system ATP-binding protein